jgi:hypothetical protein
MKKKEILEDLEIYVDTKPLTKEEELALSLFIKQLNAKKTSQLKVNKQNLQRKAAKI